MRVQQKLVQSVCNGVHGHIPPITKIIESNNFISRNNWLPSRRSQNESNTSPYFFRTMSPNTNNNSLWNENNRNGFIQCAVSENCLSNDMLINKYIHTSIKILCINMQYIFI